MKTLILTNDHQAVIKNVPSHKLEFFHKGKMYTIDATAIGLTEESEKKKMPLSYSLYFENDSNPVPFVKPDEKGPDPSLSLLNKVVAINAGRQLNQPSAIGGIVKALAGVAGELTLFNVFVGIVGLTLAIAFIQGTVSG